MSIAIDQTTLGSSATDSAASTIALTTTAAVTAGGFIVLCLGWFNNSSAVTLTSVSGGSLTWTIDKQSSFATAGSGILSCAVVSAQAASGLASATTITATLSGAANGGRSIGAMSFTGVAASSPVDGTPPATKNSSSTTAWASNSATLTAGSVLVATAYEAATDTTSTPTSPSVESFDVKGPAGSFAQTAAYRIESSAGSVAVAGTWATSISDTTVNAVAYLAAGGGGGGPTVKRLAALGVG